MSQARTLQVVEFLSGAFISGMLPYRCGAFVRPYLHGFNMLMRIVARLSRDRPAGPNQLRVVGPPTMPALLRPLLDAGVPRILILAVLLLNWQQDGLQAAPDSGARRVQIACWCCFLCNMRYT